MPAYSRNSPMPVSGAFGQPMRGNAIRGVQARHTLSGPGGGGPLSGRRYNYKEEAEKAAVAETAQAERAAAERGRAASIAANKPAAPVAASPAKPVARQGQLIASSNGGVRWAKGEELDSMDKAKAARKESRKIMAYKRPVPPMTAAPMERMS